MESLREFELTNSNKTSMHTFPLVQKAHVTMESTWWEIFGNQYNSTNKHGGAGR